MGFNPTKKEVQIGALVNEMKKHPNYKELTPNTGETLVAFSLRCAAHLISPPQEEGEDYELECVDVAVAIQALAPDIEQKWNDSLTNHVNPSLHNSLK
ncbi:hypothetical protein [Fibrisoma montanum]|nr:hypothetical protein [Fibrisoma montanum]